MTTGKALLIVGGVGVGGFVLWQFLKPGSTLRPASSTAPRQTASGDWVSGLIAPISNALSNVLGPNGAAARGPAASGQAASPTFWSNPSAAAANYNDPYYVTTDSGSYSRGAYDNYAYADSHPGTALPEGVFGPPVPTNVTAGDDGLMSPTWF
jgi:hypothetical protein